MFKSMLTRRNAMLGAAALVAAVTLAQPAAAITPDEIKARGKIIVGIQGDNPPWGFVTSSGKQDGLDADIATLFAKELGVSVEFVPLEVNNRIPALTAGRVDVLFATMAMLPDRAKAVQFSKPYVANAIVLIGPKSAEIKTNADMAKFTVGVAKGAAQDTQVTKNAPAGTTIRRYDGDAPSVQALVSGQVETLGGNIFYMDRVEKARPGEFENKLEFQKLYNGACTRLGEKEINAALNTFIDKIKANGELKAVYDKWMKVPVPEFPETLEGIPFAAN
ncbi:transporter substrate-binding domain-containing protein (plasmid) [Rhizobium leguminosarum bv. viciae 248]|jgi:polar amino acid transport system substrate-binding protein|uniref:Amino acid ABC transporter substrate-binding protein (PAAT family) n=2 Tax=Rhizobium TaxID=379 RepID=A0A1S9GBX4_9HYPH|nr:MULTISPECIES: transporter substrate-binding domain-containing protein [Rhizobium]EJC71084.1 periplasmic component of amino acid ABC-type transporter/signal transduction system [Rhizobium leguminosarum bv. viciae WSM1455]WSG98761.1 transporter substrate-binding domain-containing protein [Rhizobium johnstonii]AHF87836.1 ABC transporter substrate-binding protein [Rhizobium leguminosarum bv. trifolii WSM1689]MBB3165636.1 polar amino acid transport system substrate-binding protein [Rhizobium lagu